MSIVQYSASFLKVALWGQVGANRNKLLLVVSLPALSLLALSLSNVSNLLVVSLPNLLIVGVLLPDDVLSNKEGVKDVD